MERFPVLKIEYAMPDGSLDVRETVMDGNQVSDNGIAFSLDERDGVVTPRMISDSPHRLRTVGLFFPFPDKGRDLLCYGDEFITNECTGIKRLTGGDTVRSSSLVLVRDADGVDTCPARGIGFVTSHRFFTWLTAGTDGITAVYFMEDKALVPGEEYIFEKFMMCSGERPETFLSLLAATIKSENGSRELENVPVGFCSWSRYYGDVNEEKILGRAKEMAEYLPDHANLVQIDDGWQGNISFCGDWVYDQSKFPHGMAYLADEIHSHGMKFGLWLAPFHLARDSKAFGNLKDLARMDHEFLKNVFVFELDKPEFLDYLYSLFKRIKEEYRCDYMKLDFIYGAIAKNHGETDDGIFTYESDYCIAVFRKALETIRRAVGNDTVLLSCGSPMLATAGIFDLRRVACDIIWGKKREFPSYWKIMQDAAGTVFHRYYYNMSGMMNDADGIVVRDYDVGDGFDCTYSEAGLWAVTAAMSGGSILVNDELGDLSRERRDLFLKQLPPLGAIGRPADFFEDKPSAVIAEYRPGTYFVALFHYGEGYADMSFPVSKLGMEGKALIFDCLKGRYAGEGDTVSAEMMSPHSASLFMVKKIPDMPEFLYSTGNLFLGQNLHESVWDDGRLTVSGRRIGGEEIFAFFPEGSDTPDMEKTGTGSGTIVRME